MSTQIPSQERKSCSKSQKQTCVEGQVVNEQKINKEWKKYSRKEKWTWKENSPFKREENG